MSCSDYHMTRESGLPSLSILRSVHRMTNDGTSTIVGNVSDRETGEPICLVSVNLEGTKYGAVTDSLGNYVINNVPIGIYNIRARWLAGFHKAVLDSLNIHANEMIILDFRLAQEGVEYIY